VAAVALAAAATPRIVGFMLSDSGVRGSRGCMRDLGAAARIVVRLLLSLEVSGRAEPTNLGIGIGTLQFA